MPEKYYYKEKFSRTSAASLFTFVFRLFLRVRLRSRSMLLFFSDRCVRHGWVTFRWNRNICQPTDIARIQVWRREIVILSNSCSCSTCDRIILDRPFSKFSFHLAMLVKSSASSILGTGSGVALSQIGPVACIDKFVAKSTVGTCISRKLIALADDLLSCVGNFTVQNSNRHVEIPTFSDWVAQRRHLEWVIWGNPILKSCVCLLLMPEWVHFVSKVGLDVALPALIGGQQQPNLWSSTAMFQS